MNLVDDGPVYLGFRPEASLPHGIEGGDDNITLPFRVTRIEYLGADRLVYGVLEGRTPESHVISKIPTNVRTELTPGQSYKFVVRRRDMEHFDRDSGLRLDGGAS